MIGALSAGQDAGRATVMYRTRTIIPGAPSHEPPVLAKTLLWFSFSFEKLTLNVSFMALKSMLLVKRPVFVDPRSVMDTYHCCTDVERTHHRLLKDSIFRLADVSGISIEQCHCLSPEMSASRPHPLPIFPALPG